MRVFWQWFCILCGIVSSGPLLAAAPIRVFTTQYPPYAAPALQGGGAAVLMLREILAPLGHAVQVDFLPWARLARELKQQRYDLVLLAWPGDLSQHGLMPSSPWFVSRLGLFVRREQLRRPGLGIEALRGQSVGVVRDYAYPPEILAGGLQFELGTSDEQNLRKLAAGRFEYALLEHAVGRYLLRRQEAGKSAEEIVWQEPALAELPIHVGVVPGRPNAAALLEALELGLQAYKRDGRYQRLLLQHQLDGVPDLKLPRPVLRP